MFAEKVKATIKNYRLFKRGEKVVVGVSGGPDSTSLLYVLHGLKSSFGLKLHVAHLNHMLRKNSGDDEKFVACLAAKLKLPVTCARVNLKSIPKKGSLEEIARNARLAFLFKVARDIKTDKIALGHNLDDRAETVLMRILRGCGLYGLSGIIPVRDIRGYKIVRPLLEVTRKEVEGYLKKRKIKPRLDESNLDDTFFRNRIRNRLLPLLEKDYNRNIRRVLATTAETAGYDYEYLTRCAGRSLNGSGKKLSLKMISGAHPAMRRLLLRMIIARVKGDLRRIEFRHIQELEELIFNRPTGSVVDLPKGISAVKKKKHLSFSKPQDP
ncbi:tRNA lysidine(34) synthetase TilS [Candidatus Omnitrophota bacterium]